MGLIHPCDCKSFKLNTLNYILYCKQNRKKYNLVGNTYEKCKWCSRHLCIKKHMLSQMLSRENKCICNNIYWYLDLQNILLNMHLFSLLSICDNSQNNICFFHAKVSRAPFAFFICSKIYSLSIITWCHI